MGVQDTPGKQGDWEQASDCQQFIPSPTKDSGQEPHKNPIRIRFLCSFVNNLILTCLKGTLFRIMIERKPIFVSDKILCNFATNM